MNYQHRKAPIREDGLEPFSLQIPPTLTSIGFEYFVLQNPAYLRDLLDVVLLRHPSISPQMIASMLILIDGAPAKTGAALEDGDEVDFIPLVAGG